ncbi:MAG: ROK family protein [Chlamydiota bacterium]
MNQTIIFLIILMQSYIYSDVEIVPSQETFICLEIGHTRIKAATLPSSFSLEDIKKIKVITSFAKPYLQQNLSDLFQNESSPIFPLLKSDSSTVSLSIFGPIFDGKIHGNAEKEGVPKEIKSSLENDTKRTVLVEGDAACFAAGALEYLNLSSHPVQFPCLVITLGTGVGVAFAENPYTIHSLELWGHLASFPNFALLTEVSPPSEILNKRYLSKISQGDAFIEEKMHSGYAQAFQTHVEAFVKDISAYIHEIFPQVAPICSVVIGGGLSRFLNASSPFILLTPQNLENQGFDPDIIQLLGCHRLCKKPHIFTSTYPSLEETSKLIESFKKKPEDHHNLPL